MKTHLIVNLGVIKVYRFIVQFDTPLIALTEKTWGLDRAESEIWNKMVTISP